MLEQVDVEIDGVAEDCQQVGQLADLVHPSRPGDLGIQLKNIEFINLTFQKKEKIDKNKASRYVYLVNISSALHQCV